MSIKKTIRKFNQEAYNECDHKPKLILNKLMLSKGYTTIYGLNEDDRKKHDMIFEKDNKKIIFENEVRECFDVIKNKYQTIHIPYRKISSIADFYIVWKNTYDEFILIKFDIIRKSKLVTLKCKNPKQNITYEETMIDVLKSQCDFFYLNNNNLWKKNITNQQLLGEFIKKDHL